MSKDNNGVRDEDWDEFDSWMRSFQESSQDKDAFPLAPDSILAGDEDGMFTHVSVAAVVRSFLDSAVDDLAAAYALVSESGRLSPVGIPTLVRGAIELCGLGMWVITGQERGGRQTRALRVAHDSSFNAMQFFKHLSQDDAAPSNVREEAAGAAEMHGAECEKSVENAAKLGIKRTKVTARLDRTGVLKEVDRARETSFFSHWQLCSGFAHGLAWAPQFFHTFTYTHAMEGGGNLTGRTLDLNGAYTMLGWGRRAINELDGSFSAARMPYVGSGAAATLVARPWGKPFEAT